jgi:protein-tyrosine phosphatase
MKDMSADPEAVRRALSELDALLAAGRTVYLHCLGGLGRTGTVVASYLAEMGLAAPDAAAALVGSLRSSTDSPSVKSPQTKAQELLVASRRPGPSALPLI